MAKILLLEDDIQLNETIKKFLELKGYDVTSVFDGYEAEDTIYEESFDLLLLDVKVPKQSGFELLNSINNQHKHIPAIFITSLNSVDDVEQGFKLGCDDYIRKPFALKELLIRVESLLKRYNIVNEDVIELDIDTTFNTKELQLIKGGKVVPLKTKELMLLELFIQNRGKLLEYNTIFDKLWSYDSEPNVASLRTYIKTLRSAIEIGRASCRERV